MSIGLSEISIKSFLNFKHIYAIKKAINYELGENLLYKRLKLTAKFNTIIM